MGVTRQTHRPHLEGEEMLQKEEEEETSWSHTGVGLNEDLKHFAAVIASGMMHRGESILISIVDAGESSPQMCQQNVNQAVAGSLSIKSSVRVYHRLSITSAETLQLGYKNYVACPIKKYVECLIKKYVACQSIK